MSLKRLNKSDYLSLVGSKFGKLTIMSFIFGGKTKALCICDCGKETTVIFNNLKNKTKSCGCLRSFLLSKRKKWTREEKKALQKLRESKSKRWLTDAYKSKKREWLEKNKDYIRGQRLQYHYKRLATDISYKLKKNIRNRFKAAFKNKYKTGSAIENLGCSIEEFKLYLESKFKPGMNWHNYGINGWHIDHIKPLSSFDLTDIEQLKKACHYTNLQPLWAKENLSKGSKNGQLG